MIDKTRTLNRQNDFWAIWDAGIQAGIDDKGDFVQNGLRAAIHSRPIPRSAILNDVALLLGCRPSDLEFLFDGPRSAANDLGPITMPDYRYYDATQRSLAAE